MRKVTPQQAVRPVHLWLLLAIFLLGMALRLHGLDADSMWTDEIFTAERAQLDLPTLVSRLAAGEGRGVQLPLTYVVTHFFVVGFGLSEFALRLPSLLAGSLSVLLIYRLGALLWSRNVGLAGAFLLAVNPYHVQYSQEARHYSLMVFLAMLSLIFLVTALKRNTPALWLGFTLSTILGLYNHYFAFLFLPAEIALGAWLIADNWSSLRGLQTEGTKRPGLSGPTPVTQGLALFLSLILVGVSLLPWAAPFQSVTSSPAGSAQVGLSIDSLLSSLSFLVAVLVSFSGVGGLALVLWLGAFVLGCAGSSKGANLLVILGVGITFLFLTVVGAEHALFPKYVLFLLPLYLLVVARGLFLGADLLHRLLQPYMGERRWFPALARTTTLLFLGALSIAPLGEYYRSQKEDWRAAAAYLHEHMAEGDIVVSDGQQYGQGGDAKRALEGLPYYFSLYGQDVSILQAERGLADSVQQAAHAGAGMWAVLWHVDDLNSSSQLGEEIKIAEFHNVAVVSLSQPGGNTLEDTVSLLHALLLLQPTTVGRFDLHLALAELYDQMGQPQEAASQALLAEEVAQDPSLKSRNWGWEPYWDLGKTFQQLGMHEKAAPAFEEVVRINPDNTQAYMELGTAYRKSAEPAKALAAYQQALAIEPENAQLHFLLGEAYRGLGRVAEATLAYQEALRLDPTHVWSQRTLRLLSPPPEEDIPHPLLRSLGQQIALLGYDLRQPIIEPGATLDLTLWWQALAKMDRDYTTFVHLKGADNRVCAQEDSLLTYDGQPTSAWRLGMVAKGDVQLRLPPDLPPGEYTIIVGVYYWETGERLPVWDEQAQRQPDDVIALGVITVAPSDI